VYCESGRTTVLTTQCSDDVPSGEVIQELSVYLSSHPDLDYITFSGCGEPLLNKGISDVVRFLKSQFSEYSLALLTNGTLFYRNEIRKNVLDIDVIVASLDAVSENVFKQVNRPDPGLDPQTIIKGLIDLRQEFTHELWLEIFIVPGLNDTHEELEKLSEAARNIGADRIQLNSLDRPGTETWVKTLEPSERQRVLDYFSGIEIIGTHAEFEQKKLISDEKDVENKILGLIKRRPCTVEDIELSIPVGKPLLKSCLGHLCDQGLVTSEKQKRGEFYRTT